MKVLWLASWYPNPVAPFDGDFIQRHARALSLVTPLTVFFVNQTGNQPGIPDYKWINQSEENLQEKILLFKTGGGSVIDRILFNYRYQQHYKKAISDFIATEGKPDIVHVHVPMKAGLIARWIKKKWGIPYVLTEHSSHYGGLSDDDFGDKGYWYRSNTKKIFRDAAAVTNVSVTMAERLKKVFNIPEVSIIHNTVDTNLFTYKKGDSRKFRFIHVSTLRLQQKNPEGILEAAAILNRSGIPFELVMVGPVEASLHQLVEKLELSSIVKFTGEIPYTQVAQEMNNAHAFVLFSRHENFPCVIIEALASGLPVITSDVGGAAEAITTDNGKIVRSEDIEGLVKAMSDTISDYAKYDRKEISIKATGKFSYTSIANEFITLYNRVLKQEISPGS